MRQCKKCGNSYNATPENFRPASGCSGGISHTCRGCHREYLRHYKRRRSAELAARRRENYALDQGREHKNREKTRFERDPWRAKAQRMRSGMRVRSSEFSIPFDSEYFTVPLLTIWIANNPRCSCCGVQMDVRDKAVAGRDRTPSVDRIVPDHGYVRGNVAIICWRCNNLKRDATADELQAVVNWMRRIGNQSQAAA